MTTIRTLIQDIQKLLTQEEEHEFNQENLDAFGEACKRHVTDEFKPHEHRSTLRMSNIGTKCARKLWYSINKPELGEKLTGATRMKFLFGDLIEELILFLAKEAGHRVEGEQDKLEINGIEGHRDAVIDGVLTDVKSASTFSYKNFANHLEEEDDKFGYLDQLNAYLKASVDDPLVEDKNTAAFLVLDKTLGNMTLDVHAKNNTDYEARMEQLKVQMKDDTPPDRYYTDLEHGKKGNRKLCTECQYCSFKQSCWPGLRTFLYSNKPEFLTVVADQPKVPEA